MKPASNKPSFNEYLIEDIRIAQNETVRVKKILAKAQMLVSSWNNKAKETRDDSPEQAQIYSFAASQLENVLNKATNEPDRSGVR